MDHPDSSLSRKFGRETVNYFSGVPVNRLSWLRTDYEFLRKAFQFDGTHFFALNDLNPLVDAPDTLSVVSFKDVSPITGEDPFGPSEEELIKRYDSSSHSGPLVIFIGLLENDPVGFEHKDFKGRPVFAVDVTPRGPYADAARAFIDEQQQRANRTFLQGRIHLSLNSSQGKISRPLRSRSDLSLREERTSSGKGEED